MERESLQVFSPLATSIYMESQTAIGAPLVHALAVEESTDNVHGHYHQPSEGLRSLFPLVLGRFALLVTTRRTLNGLRPISLWNSLFSYALLL